MYTKLRVGVLGGTGLVGQRFVTLLHEHPWFEVVVIGASSKSEGKTYSEAVKDKWKLTENIPESVAQIVVKNASNVEEISKEVDFVFCAVDMSKAEIIELEESYARAETPVVSNNSAHRWTSDVPVVIPEINSEHLEIIESQRKRLGTKIGFIACKPNCSVQSYVPALHALKAFEPIQVLACTYQALSGGGLKKLCEESALDNVNPYIGGEEEKSENEPLKIWGEIYGDEITKATGPIITSQCIRVPVTDGHMAAVFCNFLTKPTKEEILEAWSTFKGKPQILNLPSAPKQFLNYFTEDDRPQTRLDRDLENGMGISLGRLREDKIFQYKWVGLAHNAIRGAAGGAVLIAELLKAEGYLVKK